MPEYVIEARSYRIGFATHNFWVLADADSAQSIAELHGLATSRVTGLTVPIGTSDEHSLRVYVFPHEPNYAESLGVPVKFTRMFSRSCAHAAHRGADGLARWSAAVAAIPLLNDLDLDYPPYGFNIFGLTVNSNSAYRTFGEIMGIPVHEFTGVIGPGIYNRMLALAQIDLLRYKLPDDGELREKAV